MSEYLMGIDFDGQASEQARLSGTVNSYTLSPEEIERLYGKPVPSKPKRHVGWPECGQPNLRHIARQSSVELEEEDSEINLEEEIDVDEIERVESGATEPVFRGPFSEEDYIDSEWGGPLDKQF